MLFHVVAVLALAAFSLVNAQLPRYLEVETEYGTVRGTTINVDLIHTQVDVTGFYGIPFARAPVGELRFEAPQKAIPWQGVFDGDGGRLRLPAQCMQDPASLMYITHPLFLNYDEDCLNMIIYTPSVSDEPKAVMVWFYGGGYVIGGNIQYPGHFLAARGVVVAAPNYRIGVFGFAATPDGTIPGNMGMRDQILALQFIQDNIANFGGDRNRVTIFGQSAGASSASLLILSPESRGLFHQAILESGADNNIWTLNYPEQNPKHYIYQVAERLNTSCIADSDPEMIDCMRNVPARDLRMVDWVNCTPGFFCQGFAPIVDGEGGFMPERPIVLREKLGADSVPMITGITSDDGSLFTLFLVPESSEGGFTREEWLYLFRYRLASIFAASAATEEIYENTCQAFEWYYTPWPFLEDLEENRQAFNRMITDAAFGVAWDRQSKLNSEYAPTYTYIAKFRSLSDNDTVPIWMGNPHTGELAYVWGYSYLTHNAEVRQQSGINLNILTGEPDDIIYSDYVQTLWTNFAKSGNPTPLPIKAPFDDTLTTWPEFKTDDKHKVFFLDDEISVIEDHRQQQYAFYVDYISYVSGHPILKKSKPNAAASTSTRKKYQVNTADQKKLMNNYIVDLISSRMPEKLDELLQILKDEAY